MTKPLVPISAQTEAIRSLIKIVEGVSKPRPAERALAVEQAKAAVVTLEMLAGERK